MAEIKTDSMNKSAIHAGHRKRLRERFYASNGFEGFADHNILELLLFYAIPRKDTNELAHALLNRFGSFERVLEASHSDLIKVEGISDNTACLIELILPTYKRYSDNLTKNKRTFDSTKEIIDYIKNLYVCTSNEKVIMLCFDARFNLINCCTIGEGDISSASFEIRKMMEVAIEQNVSSVIVAHNHPHGIASPSSVDIETTYTLANMLKSINVRLIDHIIVANNEHYAMSDNSQFNAHLLGLRRKDFDFGKI